MPIRSYCAAGLTNVGAAERSGLAPPTEGVYWFARSSTLSVRPTTTKMTFASAFSWRLVKIGVALGAVIGGLFSVFILVASPHVPFGPNLLWGPVMAGGICGAVGILAAAIIAGLRLLRPRPNEEL
jgi:hypothetical protein